MSNEYKCWACGNETLPRENGFTCITCNADNSENPLLLMTIGCEAIQKAKVRLSSGISPEVREAAGTTYRADGLIGAKAWAYDGVCRELGVERDCIGVIHAFRARIATLEQQVREMRKARENLAAVWNQNRHRLKEALGENIRLELVSEAIDAATAATNKGGSEG